MARLTGSLRLMLAGAVMGVVLLGAAALPFLANRDLGNSGSGVGTDDTACWGCTPYERLYALFHLQELATEPRIRQIDRQLAARTLTAGERSRLNGQRRAAASRLAAAQYAARSIEELLDACRADRACRDDPAGFQSLTCTGPWPSSDMEDRLRSLAARIYDQSAGCREVSCPTVNCEAQAGLQAALDELTATLGSFSLDASGAAGRRAALVPLVAELRRAFERLPLALSTSGTSALAEWASTIDALTFVQSSDQFMAQAGPETGWRLRLVRLQLGRLAQMAEEGSLTGAQWADVARRAGAGLAQVHYLEWYLSEYEVPETCESVRGDVVTGLATDLRRAAATLTVCGARSGCGEGDGPIPLAELYERAPAGLGGLDRFTSEAVTLISRHFANLRYERGLQLGLDTDLDSYGPGEAIRVFASVPANRCIAEPGARLAIFRQDQEEEPVMERETTSLSGEGGALIAAPAAPGLYEVRAFASAVRGGGELARESFAVTPGPRSCAGFTGLWDTNFGELRLYVRDGEARGTYRRLSNVPPGFLTGEVRGPVLYGEWLSELGEGGARLVIDDDGDAFSGGWSHIPGEYTGTGQWAGDCLLDQFETEPR